MRGTAREEEEEEKALRGHARKKKKKKKQTGRVEQRAREGGRVGVLKKEDTNAVITGNRICILLQNNLKIVLQISTWLFPELHWYLSAVFNNKLFVAYYRGSRVNRIGIAVLNFKNATALFLISVHF